MDDNFSQLVDETLLPLKMAGVGKDVIAEWKSKLVSCKSAEEVAKVSDILLKTYTYLKPKDVQGLAIFFSIAQNDNRVKSKPESPTHKIDPVVAALQPKVVAGDTYQLHTLDAPLSFSDVKRVVRKLVVYDSPLAEENRLPFFITNEFESEGTVLSSLYSGQRVYTLYSVSYNRKDQVWNTHFLGDPAVEGRRTETTYSLSWPFYTYKFLSESGSEYVALSQQPLPLGRAKVRGTRVDLDDKSPMGESARITTLRQILLVHSSEPVIRELSYEQARKVANKYDLEKLAFNLRGGYNHPAWFEKFLLAWVLGGKISGYPLHLAWLSEAGTGKSVIQDCLRVQFGELKEPYQGTMKGLVPNFGGNSPDEGYICKCQRIALIEEFFAIVKRARHGKNDDEGNIDLLLAVLEHRKYEQGTGKGMSIETQARARVMLISNLEGYYHYENLVEIAQHLNNPFMSRLLWYVQTPAHIDFVAKNQDSVTARENSSGKHQALLPQHDPEFISLVDTLNTLICKVEPSAVREIYDRYAQIIPEGLMEVYRARSIHHINCLVDGIAKLNWIVQRREQLEVRAEDVAEAEQIWATIVYSWLPNTVLLDKDVNPRVKLNYMTYEELKVYDFVDAKKITTIEEIEKVRPNSKAIVQRLVDAEMLKMNKDAELNWYYSPFWYGEVKDAGKEAT